MHPETIETSSTVFALCSTECKRFQHAVTSTSPLNSSLARTNETACEFLPEMPVLQASEEQCAHAILDTGASRCIIGSQTLSCLLQHLPSDVKSHVQQRPSQIKFRFGNNQTLTSMYKVLLPLSHSSGEKVWLGVEVVNGRTPFFIFQACLQAVGRHFRHQPRQMHFDPSAKDDAFEHQCHRFVPHRHG